MMWIVLVIVIWLGLGLYQAGKYYAANQELWPSIADEQEGDDFRSALLSIPFGLVSFIATGMVYGFKHKWRIRTFVLSRGAKEQR